MSRLTIYDVYPFSAEPLPEFTDPSLPKPTQDDMLGFARAVIGLATNHPHASENPTSRANERSHSVDILLPEGVVHAVAWQHHSEAGHDSWSELGVHLHIAKELGNPTTSRQLGVRQTVSEDQQVTMRLLGAIFKQSTDLGNVGGFAHYPSLIDYGVQEDAPFLLSEIGESAEPRAVAERAASPEPPKSPEGDADWIRNKVSGYLARMGARATGEPDISALPASTSELNDDAPHAVCSQRTLRVLTELLLQHASD